MIRSDTIVIGAGPAGLSCASELMARGREVLVLEKDAVGAAWRRHYDRLHLHTHRAHSGLPGLPMPKEFRKYPTRDQVVAYLEDYAKARKIRVETGETVTRIRRNRAWQVETESGTFETRQVIVATGLAGHPHFPSWPGIEGFPGPVVHSSGYRRPGSFKDQKVLVVGFGNSGGEIALDLSEKSAVVTMSVRGPVNAVPRDILGIPILSFAIAQSWLPHRLADVLNRPIIRMTVGDITRLGLPASKKGPMSQIVEDGRVPLLDIGTLDAIRAGKIRVAPGIARIDGPTVCFSDDTASDFDALILATGFRVDLRALLPDHGELLTREGAPRQSGAASAHDGLYFCNFRVSPTGQLREAGREARAIATAIAGR